jgi:hypothetical protein
LSGPRFGLCAGHAFQFKWLCRLAERETKPLGVRVWPELNMRLYW